VKQRKKAREGPNPVEAFPYRASLDTSAAILNPKAPHEHRPKIAVIGAPASMNINVGWGREVGDRREPVGAASECILPASSDGVRNGLSAAARSGHVHRLPVPYRGQYRRAETAGFCTDDSVFCPAGRFPDKWHPVNFVDRGPVIDRAIAREKFSLAPASVPAMSACNTPLPALANACRNRCARRCNQCAPWAVPIGRMEGRSSARWPNQRMYRESGARM